MHNYTLDQICEMYFGKERADKYREDPDDYMTGILFDIIDYGYDTAMSMSELPSKPLLSL